VHKEIQVLKVLLVQLEHRVLQAPKELLAHKVPKAPKVQQVHKDLLAHKVHKAI
jgi:hypothetical protein